MVASYGGGTGPGIGGGVAYIKKRGDIFIMASDSIAKDGDLKCDGTADEQQVLDALDTLPSTGGTVTLSDGTFTFATTAISQKDDVIIQGQGSQTKLVTSANMPVLSGLINLGIVGSVTVNRNVVRSLRIVMDSGFTGDGIVDADISNAFTKIHDVDVIATNNGVVVWGTDATIKDNYLHDCGYLSGKVGSGLYIRGNAVRTRILSNIVDNCGLSQPSVYLAGKGFVRVIGNHILNGLQEGLRNGETSDRCDFLDNLVAGCGRNGVSFEASLVKNFIRGNRFYNNSNEDTNWASVECFNDNSVITENYFEDDNGYCISLATAVNNYIGRNYVIGSTRLAFYRDGGGNTGLQGEADQISLA